jgi:hypothetical protein
METRVTVLRVTMERSTVAVRLEHTSHVPCTLKIINTKNVAVRLEHTSHVPCTLKIINTKNLMINQRITFRRSTIRRQGRAHQPRALHIEDYQHVEPEDKSKDNF